MQCDGRKLDLSSGPNLAGIAIVNIPSVYGGANLWGEVDKRRRRSRENLAKDINSMPQGTVRLLLISVILGRVFPTY